MKNTSKDSLGDRMKEYESVSRNFLTRRVPVICRLDGKAFHTFCKRFEKPYDETFNDIMNKVMTYICSNVQGVKFAQRHSDEISFLLTDYDTITTCAFFDYNVQKIVSVVSGMATAELCRLLSESHYAMGENNYADGKIAYLKFGEKWPCFDCRCFSIPEHEISNYYWWRLLDCKRNSISMNAQAKFSHKELQGKNCEEMQEMLFSKHGINWNNIPQGQKSGYVSYRKKETKVVYARGPADEHNGRTCERNAWLLVPSPKTKSELDEVIISVLKKQE